MIKPSPNNRSNDVLEPIQCKSTSEPECPSRPTCSTTNFTFEEFKCFRINKINETIIDQVEDVLDSPRKPTPGNSIFFIMTSCTGDGVIPMKPRLFR